MAAAEELTSGIGYTAPACAALGVPRASLYRWRRPGKPRTAPRPTPPRALMPTERQKVLDHLRSPRFVDRSPAQVWAALLDNDIHLCSIRTMYRILAENAEVKERRNQLRHPIYQTPELMAEAPNQVWSWDITKLSGPVKGTWFHLYVILDILSRYTVGWMVAQRESAALAKRLISETCTKQGIAPDQLTIHADRGASMRSKTVALLLSDLGVIKSHSRPYVSNDNPYSESQFKTMKYCPQFPDRFGSIQDARKFCGEFFNHYNNEHYHSGIGLLPPAIVHYGKAEQVLASRQETLLAAYRAHPERFVHRPPQPPSLPLKAWINPPVKNMELEDGSETTIVTPGDPLDLPSQAASTRIVPISVTPMASTQEDAL